MMPELRVAFRTFGCKTNQYDTERMRQEIEARGARAVPPTGPADLVVVNTCTVTNQADAEARRYVRRVGRNTPGVPILVVGCSAALRGNDYRAMPEVAGVVAGHDPTEVAGAAGRVGRPLVQLGLRGALERMDQEPVGAEVLLRREGASRGWLKVQDGCDRRCSFCATRLARGRSRSRPADEVVAEAHALCRTHPELVITGIHIGHYGRDLQPAATLSMLVARLLDEVPGVRFRLGSIEATEVDDLLLRLLESSGGRLARHLHMPLQSGADPVLRRMRRWHTREAYRSRALEIADRLGVLGLGADIITGFPGETEADHEATRSLVEELPFTYLHVFPFSPRRGTPAADARTGRPVPERVRGERGRELRLLAEEKGRTYRLARAGSAARVVVEGGKGTALTGDYLRVRVRTRRVVPLPDGSGALPARSPAAPALQEGRLVRADGDLAIDLSGPAHFN